LNCSGNPLVNDLLSTKEKRQREDKKNIFMFRDWDVEITSKV
jgi:hypothetical protein